VRVAIVGMGAVGHLMAQALDGRADLVRIDRWMAPLPDGVAPVEALLVTTKTPGTNWAADIAVRILAPDGLALTIQNGLGNLEILAKQLGSQRVARGVVYVGAQLLADGTLVATGPGRLEIGKPLARATAERLERLAGLLRAGGVSVEILDDLSAVVWRKLVVNCAVNPTTALLACTNAELLSHPTGLRLADAIARETVRVAAAAGVILDEDFALRNWREVVLSFSANPHSSMLQDVFAGRETEIDAINGAVARVAAQCGVPAPLNSAMAILIGALHPSQQATVWTFSPSPSAASAAGERR
jgi:2-dehydropantoate 2-reductase